MQKRGKLNRSYRKRYVVLGELPDHKSFEMLYFGSTKAVNDYFNGDENVEPCGIIALNTITHVSKEQQKLVIKLHECDHGRIWDFKATSKEDFESWCESIHAAVSGNKRQHFHTFATRRKKLDLQAFRRAVGAVFGLLIAQDIIDGVFRELSEQNMQLLSSV